MIDRTASQRIKRQRDDRIREGWQEVRVWVPTNQDAEDVRKLAAERRALAEAQLREITKEEACPMNLEANIADALAQHGSSDYITPSGAVMTLMKTLAEHGDLEGFSQAFVTFARAKPRNASFVQSAAPAKVLNGYLFHHLGLDFVAFQRWERSNRAWGDKIIAALREPVHFVQVVNRMAKGIQQVAIGTN